MGSDKPKDEDGVPHERAEPRPDFSKPLPRQTLSKDLQKVVDSEDSLMDSITDGTAEDSTNSNVRYAAYASRLRTIMLSAHRYVAYTSDIGESFRPVAHPNWVRGAYGVSWMYLFGDVAYEGYKAYLHNQKTLHPEKEVTDIAGSQSAPLPPGRVAPIDDYRTRMAERAIFQSVASMGLPAFTIHSIVRYSGQALKNAKAPKIRTWGPIGLGLAAVPALPYMFDKPVETATEWLFHTGFELVGGPSAVGKDPATGLDSREKPAEKAQQESKKEL